MLNYLQTEDDGLPMRSSGLWVAEKLDYLTRYVNMFETSMRSKWPVRNYIDLMAGPGKNRIRSSNDILLGSPLIALTIEHPFTGYIFTDISRKNTTALTKRCSTSPFFSRVDILTGDCNILVNEIVDRLRRNEQRSLNLAFLDPDGLELHWETVAKLATVERMDLVIYYPQMGFNRYMEQASISTEQTKVDLFFGGKEWRDIYASSKSRKIKHRQLIDLYKSKLKALGYTEVIRGTEDVDDEPLIRNRRLNIPLYRLIFASKHNLGYKFWLKVVKKDIHGQIQLF
jgi:three-Cys-motif partner protein